MNHLGVFAKYWQAGHVKTRLAASIGRENAAMLYREFVHQTLSRLGTCGHTRSLWVWPPDKQPEFSSRAGLHWTLRPQPSGDLGHRMLQFFREALSSTDSTSGPPVERRAVLVGSDSPNLPASIVEEAFAALNDHACVFGPSPDGGYYLIGMNVVQPELFQNIQWSSPRVWPQTVERLEALNLSWHRLPVWNDIDEISDLRGLAGQLQGGECPSDLDRQLLQAICQFGGFSHDSQ